MTRAHTPIRPDALHYSDDEQANRLVARDPAALVIAFLLDQQITVQKAFEGPQRLLERAGSINPADLASMPLEKLQALMAEKPAIHRFPGNMAKRIKAAMQHIVDEYDGNADRIWTEAADTAHVRARLEELPGIGAQTALTFTTVLARRFGMPFSGWESEIPSYGALGDVSSPSEMASYQQRKREYKAARRNARR